MRTRRQLRDLLDDLEADIPAMKERLGEDDEFLSQVRSRAEYAVLCADSDDRDWMTGQVDGLLMGLQIPWTVRSTH